MSDGQPKQISLIRLLVFNTLIQSHDCSFTLLTFVDCRRPLICRLCFFEKWLEFQSYSFQLYSNSFCVCKFSNNRLFKTPLIVHFLNQISTLINLPESYKKYFRLRGFEEKSYTEWLILHYKWLNVDKFGLFKNDTLCWSAAWEWNTHFTSTRERIKEFEYSWNE